MLYHYPSLSLVDFGLFRTPGPGLGNLLFPVMRAAIGQQRHGGTFVYPTFAQFKLGTLIRGERDKRFYTNVARARSRSEWGDWFKSRLTGSRQAEDAPTGASRLPDQIVYRGLRRYFHDFADHEPLVRDWYFNNMRVADETDSFDLALHIRLGDFAVDANGTAHANTRTPFHWYREAIDHAAAQIGVRQPRVLVFTDGSFDEVRNGLDVPNLIFDESEQAATAMARLAAAQMIITSRSTFSMWGAFLGNKPAIWDQAFDYEEYFPHRPGLDIRL